MNKHWSSLFLWALKFINSSKRYILILYNMLYTVWVIKDFFFFFRFRLFVHLFLPPPSSHSWRSAISSRRPPPWRRKTRPTGIASGWRLRLHRDSEMRSCPNEAENPPYLCSDVFVLLPDIHKSWAGQPGGWTLLSISYSVAGFEGRWRNA